MSAKLIILFKDSLMGTPIGLRYKVVANDKEIDNTAITQTNNTANTYNFKDDGQMVVISSTNGKQVTIPQSTVYNIQLKIIDEAGKIEKILGAGLLADGKQLTVVAVSPWTKIPLEKYGTPDKPNDPDLMLDPLLNMEKITGLNLLGSFFEVEYNYRYLGGNSTVRIVIKDIPRKIVLTALKYRGSTAWSYYTTKTSLPHPVLNKTVTRGPNVNKCNLFVYDVLTEAGISIPWTEHGKSSYIPWSVDNDSLVPPLAEEWANPNLLKANWDASHTPQPGDIGAYVVNYSNASGHVGIIIADGVTVSAGEYSILLNDVGFRRKFDTLPRVGRDDGLFSRQEIEEIREDDHDFTIFRRYKGPSTS